MTTKMRQRRTVPATPNQMLAAGYDGGNGFAKLVLDTCEVRCPSYVLPLHGALLEAPESNQGGLIEYVSGPHQGLIGSAWLAGFPAYQKAPTGCLRVVDHPRGKLAYGLQLFLGCIAALPKRESWGLSLVASIQDAQAFGRDLHAVLRGSHVVRFGGTDRDTIIEVDVLSVVEEGVGAIVSARAEIDLNGQTLLYDFGNGTCIVSVFGPKGKLVERTVTPGGVEGLIDAVATNIGTRRELSGEGDRHIIRAGIEDKSFLYGRTGWGFRAIYEAELPRWVQSTLAPTLRAAAPWRPTSSSVLAIGGGSELPAISELLAQQGIRTLRSGGAAHVRGLLTIAQAAQLRDMEAPPR